MHDDRGTRDIPAAVLSAPGKQHAHSGGEEAGYHHSHIAKTLPAFHVGICWQRTLTPSPACLCSTGGGQQPGATEKGRMKQHKLQTYLRSGYSALYAAT